MSVNQIEFLKQEGDSKNKIEKENESGYFEEENVACGRILR